MEPEHEPAGQREHEEIEPFASPEMEGDGERQQNDPGQGEYLPTQAPFTASGKVTATCFQKFPRRRFSKT